MGFSQHSDSQLPVHSGSAEHLTQAPRPHRNTGTAHGQRGMGMTSVMVIIAVCVFLGMFAFKVAPHYMENWTVSKIAKDVASDPELLKLPRSKVYSYVSQAYRTNNLWDLEPEETIKLKKDSKRGYIVTVEYEKRANLFHNIDLVTSFSSEASAAQ